jgi:hypothetical protein
MEVAMFRFFLFVVGVMAASMSVAGDVSSCPVDTVPIQIMIPASNGNEIMRSAAEISGDLPHFRVFVTDVTKHINSRLVRDKLCINSAGSTDDMKNIKRERRSLLQFVEWPLFMGGREYLVPGMAFTGPPSCEIYSPWIDLVVVREPVPQIVGIVRWNERQLLVDQAVLAGAKNVPPGMAMPPKPGELGHFLSEYQHSEFRREPEPGAKPIEERVPPDLLWLFRRSWQSTLSPFIGSVRGAMNNATKKGTDGYTKLVITLIDRCFVSDDKTRLYYNSIIDVADPSLRKQYKIDTPLY